MATTTNYGFEIPDDTDLVKDGALAMRDLGQDVDTQLFTALGGDYPGLRLVKKQTIGTGVSSVTVTGAFSATYENYKIIINNGVTNNITNISCQLGSTSSGYNSSRIINRPDSGSPTGNGTGTTSNWTYFGQGGTTYVNCNAEIISPFASRLTRYSANYLLNINISSDEFGTSHGTLNDTNSYTAFTLSVGGNTMTGGTIYVYGYGAS